MAEVKTGGDGDGANVPDSFPGEENECKICYNHFDLDLHTPKLLGCSHIFCQECLDTLCAQSGRGGGIDCPLCRVRTHVPDCPSDNLSDNGASCEVLPLTTNGPVGSANTGVIVTSPAVSPACCQGRNGSRLCTMMTGSACAFLSFLAMLLFVVFAYAFLKEFKPITSTAGFICLSIAGIFALYALILTWMVYVLKSRPGPSPV